MEEGQLTRKQRRVHSFDPRRMELPHRAIFSHKYLNTLLPALLKIDKERSSCDEKDDYEIMKIVKFQVDMALVLSSECRFGWSRALKQELDQTHTNSQHCSYLHAPQSLLCTHKQNGISSPYCVTKIHNTSEVPTGLSLACNFTSGSHEKYPKKSKRIVSWRGSRRKKIEDKFDCRLRTLGKILPGGKNMEANELLSEVESYVVCLELQEKTLGGCLANRSKSTSTPTRSRSNSEKLKSMRSLYGKT